jgi:ABC-type glutathione transport system ATPase component
MRPLQANAPSASGLRESCSPSPSRRRRSGSRVPRDIHQLDAEDPPDTLFHVPEVQNALVTARALTSRITDVLSISNLHREKGSRIEDLYRKAVKLDGFQLPSSRIIGLVGDSGAGKSSLINSLLDNMDLTRAVSRFLKEFCTCG